MGRYRLEMQNLKYELYKLIHHYVWYYRYLLVYLIIIYLYT